MGDHAGGSLVFAQRMCTHLACQKRSCPQRACAEYSCASLCARRLCMGVNAGMWWWCCRHDGG